MKRILFAAALPALLLAQPSPPPGGFGPGGPPGGFGPGGPGGFGPGGRGGPGGFGGMGQETKLVAQFDRDNDKRLNDEERAVAREHQKTTRASRGGPGGRGPGGFGGRGPSREPGSPGVPLAAADVRAYSTEPFYDPTVLRTLFLEFKNPEWEPELEDFYRDVQELALRVDRLQSRTERLRQRLQQHLQKSRS